MKNKYVLLTTTVMSIVVSQPAMAAAIAASQIDQWLQRLQNMANPILMIISLVLAINVFFSGQLSFIQIRKKTSKIWGLILMACMSFVLCSLPSLVVGEFGSGNVALLLINGVFIAYGLLFRSQ
ncbi:hypothetical protein ACSYAD_23130 [Acaryochloris marina NIES-2412]|uniref:hypothetical protein n=1 Tax=Acaryochloris marina TaxID=155978 RepID=UPI004057CE6A